MSVRLRPLREDEWPAFVEDQKLQYAQDMVENGGLSPEAAAEKAEQDFVKTLPDGLATEGHFISVVEDAATGDAIGRLWFAIREIWRERVAFVYDVYIDEKSRGRGFGRAAMLALEEEVRTHGIERVSLNVFGGNAVARGLYDSLGYRETAVWMAKDLSSEPSSPN
jgi:ribosomal protein S18 acetylase RimI-like enzyme